jgi:hypothetical protein
MLIAEAATVELLNYSYHTDVLAAMSRHSEDKSIVGQCCFILGNLIISGRYFLRRQPIVGTELAYCRALLLYFRQPYHFW